MVKLKVESKTLTTTITIKATTKHKAANKPIFLPHTAI